MNSHTGNKIVLLGPSGIGKTCLVQRFMYDIFNKYTESTIGSSYMCKYITVDKKPLKLEIWDTAGQERYNTILPMYIRDAAVLLLCSDKLHIRDFSKYYKLSEN